ncbi:FAD-linked oxidase C-terminal domain-containing protein [Actinomadura sp. NPDC048021]|uniref:FAD-linked oxidase C-terminal domain-containing protein n=1 Tax=Actinomadura sp. NPDC048021 TaxID=3155385 RepID=UPI003410CEE8
MHDPREEERLWRVREAGLGATAYPPGRADTHEGWKDAAVPPDRLGDYLRDFRALIEEFGYGPTRSPTTVRVIAQPHCHQHAVMGFGADQCVLARAGVDVRTLDAGEGTAVLADGSSCRTQIEPGTAARPRHLAELLADLLPDEEGR